MFDVAFREDKYHEEHLFRLSKNHQNKTSKLIKSKNLPEYEL